MTATCRGIDWFELHGDVQFDDQVATLPELLKALTDSRTGTLATRTSTLEDQLALNEKRIEDMDVLLEAKRQRLLAQFIAMEQAIAQLSGGVEWDEDALARVLSAPDFNRAGIKKAAELNARKEGLERITSADLTRFRNRAMMRAVQRMKGFGMDELSFKAYEIARERVPRLKDNLEADKRFATIRRSEEHTSELQSH